VVKRSGRVQNNSTTQTLEVKDEKATGKFFPEVQ
jgi:hypothetical protein